MHVLVTCKNVEHPIKHEGARVATTKKNQLLGRSRAANSFICDGILQKQKAIQAFIIVLDSCKNEEDSEKK